MGKKTVCTTWLSRETTPDAPADVADGLVGGVEDVLEEAVGLDFQKRVVGCDAVRTESLKHELALAPELVPVRREPDLWRHASAGGEQAKSARGGAPCCRSRI